MKFINGFKSQGGGTVVEFAIVFPLFIVLVFAIIEFGVIIYDKAILTNAARKTTRTSIVYSGDTPYYITTAINNAVDEYLNYKVGEDPLLINLGGTNVRPDVDINPEETERERGDTLEVTLSYNYDFVFISGFIPGLPDSFTINATSIMRIE